MAKSIPVSVTFLGNTADLEAQLARAGIVAEDASKKIAGSARAAGAAAAEQARTMGASATEQEAAAAKAAVAFTEASAKITTAQRAAGRAAIAAARDVGASVDEQRSAYTRAIASTREYEDASKKAADSAAASARASAKAIQESSAKAAKAQADAAKRSAATGKDSTLSHVGGKVATAGIAAFAAAAYEGVKGSVALQKSMEMLHTQAGVAQSAIGGLTKGVLNMAGSVGTSPQELSDGLYHVASSLNATLPAATRSATELKVLRIAAEGAKVGNANLVDVTNALDAAIVSGIKGVHNYGQAMGAMNATVGAGDMSMQQLSEAFGASGLLAKAQEAGISIKQLGGGLATLGDNLVRGAHAGTLMASTIRIMSAPSAAAAKALAAVGLSSSQLGNDLRSGGLIKAISDLKTHLQDAGATGTQQGLILTRAFGGRQSAGVSILLDNLNRLKAKTLDVGSSGQKFASDYAAYNKTAAAQVDRLKATVQSLADQFGAYLIPKLEATGHAIQSVIAWMQKHKAAAEALGIVISGVLGTAVSVFAYTKAVKFVSATKDMIGGMVKLTSGIGSAAISIAAKLGLIGTTATATDAEVSAASEGMVTKIGLVGPAATAASGEMVAADGAMVTSADATAAAVDVALGSTGIGLILVGVGTAAALMATHWSSVMSGMRAAVNWMVQGAEANLNSLIGVLNTAVSVFNSTVGQLTGKIGQVGNVGTGPVLGGGGGGGSAPAATGTPGLPPIIGAPVLNTHGHTLSNTFPGGGGSGGRVPTSPGLASYLGGGGAGGTGTGGSSRTSSRATGPAMVRSSHLTRDQQLFAGQLAIKTGLSPQVIAGWLIAEENGGAAASRQAAGNNDWLNIGYTDSGTVGATDSIWRNPEVAANATAGWLAGKNTVPGYGTASSGIQAILGTAGQSNAAQISALQRSGWASSGYPALAPDVASIGSVKVTGGSSSVAPLAAATSTIPVALATMLKTAESLVGAPYNHAGEHATGWEPIAALKKIGIDCSGFVSAVLHSGGALPTPQTTQGLPSYLKKGKGPVTVWDRHTGPVANEHTIIDILGKWFESGGMLGGGVTQMTTKQAASELAGGGFQAFHPTVGGPDATVAQLRALGISTSATSLGTSASAQSVLAQQIAAARATIEKQGTSLLGSFQSALRGRSAAPLGGLLGTKTDTGLYSTRAVAHSMAGSVAEQKFEATLTAVTGVHTKAMEALADRLVAVHKAAMKAFVAAEEAALAKPADAMLKQLDNQVQNGSVRSLTSTLGLSTGGGIAGTLHKYIEGMDPGVSINNIGQALNPILTGAVQPERPGLHHIRGGAIYGMDPTEVGKLHTSRGGHESMYGAVQTHPLPVSPQQQAFDKLISTLRATHAKALEDLANKLVAAHKAALSALSQELYAAQLKKDTETLTLTATQLKDQTTLAGNLAASQLTVQKAQAQATSDAETQRTQFATDTATQASNAAQAQTQAATDAEQAVSDAAQNQTKAAQDQATIVSNQAQAQTTYVKDMTQVAADQLAAMATAVKDQTTLMADASTARVSGITDQTQTQVDTLGERGLFGLNLVAQQLTVQLDVMKAGFDAQVNVAQQQLDALQAQADAAENAAQINLDQVTVAEDQLTALAQNRLDTVTLAEDQNTARAQAHMDAVTMAENAYQARALAHVDSVTLYQDAKVARAQSHEDSVTILQDQNITRAQAHVDSVTLAQDVKVQIAQAAADLGANLPKSKQDVLNAQLAQAQANASVDINAAGQQLTQITGIANRQIQGAASAYTNAQNAQASAVQQATAAYTMAQNAASAAVQQASAAYQNAQNQSTADIQSASIAYQRAQDQSTAAIQGAQSSLTLITSQFDVALARSSQGLQMLQNSAAEQEAGVQQKISVTNEEAQTQYQGSGTVINFTNVPTTDAAAIANEIGWVLRTRLGA